MLQKELTVWMEPYLAQWWINQAGGAQPLRLPKVSFEAKFIKTMHKVVDARQYADEDVPTGMVPVRIALPAFLLPDCGEMVILTPAACQTLRKMLRAFFDVSLWTDLQGFQQIFQRKDELVYAWMERHGIEITDTNFNTIVKRLQRLRNAYRSRMRVARHRENRKKQ